MTTTTTAADGRLPRSDADPFDLELLADPRALHEELREAGPVVYLPKYDLYAFARYSEVHAALVDWQTFQSSAGVGLLDFRKDKPWRSPSLIIEADPPRHDAPRRVLQEVLGRRAVRRLRERWFIDAEALVDEVLTREGLEFDAVTSLAEALPLRVFPDAVGIQQQGRERLLPFGDHNFNAFGPPNELVGRGAERAPELLAWVSAQCEREMLDPAGLGAEIWAAADRREITHEMAPNMVRTLLIAGVDTTVHSLSAVLYALASNPDQWRRLRAEPRLARVAFDEAIRWVSPVQTFFRTTTSTIAVGGHLVPEGHKILMFLAAANRDPRRWRDPDTFDLARDPSGQVGFGMGIHQCVGQHIARLEAEALMSALIRRVASVEMAGAPVRHLNNTLFGYEHLPVRVELA
jgi:4-methoxybenzoate monooxygenase (O-demethylating)